jgi:hypothetical protein
VARSEKRNCVTLAKPTTMALQSDAKTEDEKTRVVFLLIRTRVEKIIYV